MRDPMSWAVPLFRAFGIQVKVHIFFFIVTIGLFLRVVLDKHNPIWWVDVFLFVSRVHNFQDGRDYTSVYGVRLYKPGSAEPIPQQAATDAATKAQETGMQDREVWKPETANLVAATLGGERAVAPVWAVWLNRV